MTLAAHAKLTLSLRVTGVRDDGYHLIDAEMVSRILIRAPGSTSRTMFKCMRGWVRGEFTEKSV